MEQEPDEHRRRVAHPTVLIVEDESVARRALALLLRGLGYPTCAVASAEEALDVVSRPDGAGPEVALVDIDLPGMSGLDLVARLERTHPGVRPVLISAVNAERVHEFCRRHHDVPFIRKPLDVDAVLRAIDGPAPPACA